MEWNGGGEVTQGVADLWALSNGIILMPSVNYRDGQTEYKVSGV